MMQFERQFWEFARERYGIFLKRRDAKPWPWTSDPILQQYRFTNVFREDDRVTRCIKAEVRDVISNPEQLVTALTACRFLNRDTTISLLGPMFRDEGWNYERARKQLSGVKPITGAAYMIVTPHGMDKLAGINQIVSAVQAKAHLLTMTWRRDRTPMVEVWNQFQQFEFIGPFIAYEITLDLRRTPLLGNPPDRFSWAAVGPGSARGASWVKYGVAEKLHYQKNNQLDEVQEIMRELLVASSFHSNWLVSFPPLEMEDVENLLCEFDKYCRTKYNNKRPKQKYAHQG